MFKKSTPEKFKPKDIDGHEDVFPCQNCTHPMQDGETGAIFKIQSGDEISFVEVDKLRVMHCAACGFEIEAPHHIYANAGRISKALRVAQEASKQAV